MTALDVEQPYDVPPEEQFEKPYGPPTMLRPGIARLTEYIPLSPWPAQRVFLMLRNLEAFYGGAAGGAKSYALLMSALQFVDVPKYAALIMRKSYPDLSMPGALIDVARDWLGPTDARYSANEHAWHFPSGAQLVFGYCERDEHRFRYRSAAFQFIAIDELTQHSETVYRYMFSRLRRPADLDELALEQTPDGLSVANVPLRMRSGSNPGDVGHAWVKRRLVAKDRDPRRVFIPSRLEDNPGLDRDEYIKSLQQLHEVDWLRLYEGDWEVRDPGQILHRSMFTIVDGPFDGRNVERIRYWDLASTEVKQGEEPDFTVGALVALDLDSGLYRVEHVVRVRAEPHVVEQLLADTHRSDGDNVLVFIEQEPGASGKAYVSSIARRVLRNAIVEGDRPTGSKELRARRLAATAGRGEITVVAGPWNDEMFDEFEAFPSGLHDDIVDAVGGAIAQLGEGGARLIV